MRRTLRRDVAYTTGLAPVALLCVALALAASAGPAPETLSVSFGQFGRPGAAGGPPEPGIASPAATGPATVTKHLSVNGRLGQSPVTYVSVGGVLCLPCATLSQYLGLNFQFDQATGAVAVDFFGARLIARVGDTLAHTPAGTDARLPCAPTVADGDVLMPVAAVAQAFGMTVSEDDRSVDVSLRPAKVLRVRYTEDDARFRTTIDLEAPTPFFAVAAPSVISVGLQTAGGFVPPDTVTKSRNSRGEMVDHGPPPRVSLPVEGVLATEVSVENMDRGFVRISAHGSYDVVAQRFFTLAGPPRIVLEFPKIWENTRTEQVSQDLERTWFGFGTASGPVIAHVVLAHLSRGNLRAAVGLAGSTSGARAPLSSIVRNYGALAGVNGGYFAPSSGDPIGTLIVNGEWVRFPYADRTSLLIAEDGRLAIGNVGVSAEVGLGGRRFTVSGLNEWMPAEGEVVKVVTKRWQPTFPCTADQVCVQVRKGVVAQVIAPSQRVEVTSPDDGYLVVGRGQATKSALRAAPVGSAVSFSATIRPPMQGIREALGGGPRLVRAGAYYNTGQAERFGSDILSGRAPRSAIGLTASGDLLMVVVDGRRPGYSVGMTLPEVAELMIRLGAVDAMSLDSGGSAELFAMGGVLNKPSDNRERPVPNALLVAPR